MGDLRCFYWGIRHPSLTCVCLVDVCICREVAGEQNLQGFFLTKKIVSSSVTGGTDS